MTNSFASRGEHCSRGRRSLTPAAAAVALALLALGGCASASTTVVADPVETASARATTSPSVSESPSGSASASAATSGAPTAEPAPAPSAPAPPAPPAPASSSPTCPPAASLRGKDLEKVPTERKVVALTFDAGANADAVRPILDTLKAKNVTATFFLTGEFVNDNPALAREIGTSYVVGNHSMTHPELTKLSGEQVRDELSSAESAIRTATGRDPRPYFRFPFGDVDERTIGIANSLCYVPFRWTADTLGWQGTSGGMSADKVHTRVLSRLQPGEIVLMHLGSNPKDHSILDADALPGVIDAIRAAGYDFVSLDTVIQTA